VAKSAFARLIAILIASAALASPVAAEQLARLHVTNLALGADRTHVKIGERFSIYVRVHVTEKVDRIDNLVLPNLLDFNNLGDEHTRQITPKGTDWTERVILEAPQAGTFTIPPAFFDAVNARNGKPSRFSSNTLTIVVGQPSPLDDPGALGRRILGIALAIIGILAAVFVLLVLFVLRMRRAPRAAPPQSQAPTIVRVIDPSEALRASLGDAQRARTRASILALRGELFAREGVPRGATTRDALERIPPGSHGVRLAVTHLERAAFGPDDRLDTAIDEALGAVESLLRSGG
jgi:hypothetical protein